VKKYVSLILGALALGALSFGARADPIGPSCGPNDSESCFGNIYTLTYDGLVSDSGVTSIFDISLTIDTSGYNNPAGPGFLDAVGFKVTANGSDFIFASLLSAPTGTWNIHYGGTNANGCQDNTNGFVCVNGTSLPVPDGTYAWEFQVTVNDGTLKSDSSVKALFGDANDKHDGLTSAAITLQGCPPTVCLPQQVPEPTTLALLGIALLGAGFVGTGRRKT
jgi:hypothetical protein